MAFEQDFNSVSTNLLPGHLGIVIDSVSTESVLASFEVGEHHMAPNGFLHAGSLVSLADTACGCGCINTLPENAKGFTTVELKSNHLRTLREGKVLCEATPVHLGRTTQVWDAKVTEETSGKTLVLFRCTQMILY